MKKKIGFLAIVLTGLMLFSSCKLIPIKFAPNLGKEFKKLGINFEDKESILRLEREPELFKLWARWKPIKFLMTKEEKKIVKEILKIADNDQRSIHLAEFIKWFWAKRDDNKYDDANRFKEDFYNRVIEAQERFGTKESMHKRKCKYGKGWQSDMGLIYIILGEPFDRARHSIPFLMSILSSRSGSRSDSHNYDRQSLMPQEVEVWYFDVPLDEYCGSLFQDGIAWMLFERDASGYWEFGHITFDLFYSYELYQSYYFAGTSLSYGMYMTEVQKFIKAVARSYIYDKDLKFVVEEKD